MILWHTELKVTQTRAARETRIGAVLRLSHRNCSYASDYKTQIHRKELWGLCFPQKLSAPFWNIVVVFSIAEFILHIRYFK